MLVKKLSLIALCLVITGGIWFLLQRLHPVWVANEAIEAGRAAGGLDEGMLRDIRTADFKSLSLTFGIWGAILAGFCGLFGNARAKAPVMGLICGLVLGALAGVVSAFAGQYHDLNVEYMGATTGYWFVRWLAIAGPIAVAASLAAAISGRMGQISDCLTGGIAGGLLGIVVYIILHGVATPLEQHQEIYPGWGISRFLSMASVNLGIFTLLVTQTGRKSGEKETDVTETAAT